MNNSIFFAPHHDDETLFGAFTIQKRHPDIAICFEADYLPDKRLLETINALNYLKHKGDLILFGISEKNSDYNLLEENIKQISEKYKLAYAPADESNLESNYHHNIVGNLVEKYFGKDKTIRYLTYTWPNGRSTSSNIVPYNGTMVLRKLKAMSCYESQINNTGVMDQFLYTQYEYYE